MLNKALLLLVIIIGIVMIVMGVKTNINPPVLTGIGFLIIAFLLNKNLRKN